MNRGRLIGCLLMLVAVNAAAEEGGNAGNSDVRYVKEHLLYQRGDETNVIDIDVEWPSMVDFSAVKPLQSYLAKAVFRADADNMEDALRQLKARFGSPVTSQFKTIPDDDKFCYVTCELKEIGCQKNRFISFRASYICEPAKASTQRGDTAVALVTYDIVNERVLLMKDILKMSQLQSEGVSYPLLLQIIKGASVGVPEDVINMQMTDACLMDQWVWLNMFYMTEDDTTDFHSLVPTEVMKGVLTRDVRKLLTMGLPSRPLVTAVIDSVFEGQPVHTEVDKAPAFIGGINGLRQYLSDNVEYPQIEQATKVQGRVIVSFIVDEDGAIRDTRVIDHVSPGIDREAVRVVRMMPRWSPGELNGQKVKVRTQLPITFRMN